MEPLTFKHRPIDANGNRKGFLAAKGSVDPGEGLAIRGETIPPEAIMAAKRLPGNVVVVGLEGQAIAMDVYGGQADRVCRAVNALASAHHAERHRAELAKKGAEHEFRTATCPRCEATIDLSRFPETPYVYCPFCEALSSPDAPDLTGYCVCESCGYFGRPRTYTEFYFYFLLVVYGWRYSKHQICPACMRPKAWRMLFINAIFVLGVPVALVQLYRVYFAGQGKSAAFPGLEAANAAARARKRPQAEALYERILERDEPAPGIRYNLGRVAAATGDPETAAAHLEMALAECANYAPAFGLLRAVYKATGRADLVRDLDELWEVQEDPDGAPSEQPAEEPDAPAPPPAG